MGDLDRRLVKLETKWEQYDITSERRHKENKEYLAKIWAKLDILPCKTTQNDIKWHGWAIKILWGVLIVGGLIKGVLMLNGNH